MLPGIVPPANSLEEFSGKDKQLDLRGQATAPSAGFAFNVPLPAQKTEKKVVLTQRRSNLIEDAEDLLACDRRDFALRHRESYALRGR